jgi:hypothetical protein
MGLQREMQREINSDTKLAFRGHQKFLNLLLAAVLLRFPRIHGFFSVASS